MGTASLEENLFVELDPRGFTVVCTRERWMNHVVDNRQWMDSEYWRKLAAATVRIPLEIHKDRKFKDRECYYSLIEGRSGSQRYMEVVVVVAPVGSTRHLHTAFPSDGPKKGEAKTWP